MTSSFNQNVRLPLCLRDASSIGPVADSVLRLGLGLTHFYPYYRFLVPHAYCYHIFYLYATKPLLAKIIFGIVDAISLIDQVVKVAEECS